MRSRWTQSPDKLSQEDTLRSPIRCLGTPLRAGAGPEGLSERGGRVTPRVLPWVKQEARQAMPGHSDAPRPGRVMGAG